MNFNKCKISSAVFKASLIIMRQFEECMFNFYGSAEEFKVEKKSNPQIFGGV